MHNLKQTCSLQLPSNQSSLDSGIACNRFMCHSNGLTVCPPLCRLSAQLARTEEAAKRALVQSDPSAKGGAAQKLLDAERTANRLREENADLTSKLARFAFHTWGY